MTSRVGLRVGSRVSGKCLRFCGVFQYGDSEAMLGVDPGQDREQEREFRAGQYRPRLLVR